jgi:hypothetical protein
MSRNGFFFKDFKADPRNKLQATCCPQRHLFGDVMQTRILLPQSSTVISDNTG